MDKIGKFKIIEEIGKGGMGIVYRALDPHIDREVAIKVILERELAVPELKERFYREARSAGKLSHENITIVHEVGEIDGKPYIVMEYLKGNELATLIVQKKAIDLNRKISYAIQICKALQFAHENKIIHRDIKPENIMVLEDDKIKIMDFGIARPESSNLTQQGMIVGTLAYMSPEQIKGLQIDNRSDIFSFGVLLYELLTYKKPFQGNNTTIMYKIVNEEPERIILEASAPVEALQEVLSKCLQKDTEDRYGDCSLIIKDLETLLFDQQQDRTISGLLIEARAFFEEKRLHDAQIRYDKILAIDPNNEEALFLKQKCFEIENQIETMIVSVDQKRAEVTALRQSDPQKKARKSQVEIDKSAGSPVAATEKTSRKGLRFALVALITVILGAAGWYYLIGPGKVSTEVHPDLASASRDEMLSLKRNAEEANAEGWAEATFALALQAEQKAEQKFEAKSYAEAKQTFAEAGDLFQKSLEEAKTNFESAAANADYESLKNMVAEARKDMLRQKSAAEKAGAPTAAKRTFNSALAKEKEGERTSQGETRESLLASRNAFLRAKTEYRNAGVKAGKLRRSSTAVRTEMTRAKQQVPKEQRDNSDLYQNALTLESVGNKQLRAGDYDTARKSFQQAKGFYTQAIKDALRLGADEAKNSMLAIKAKIGEGRNTDPDYRQSVEMESRGNDAYKSNKFMKAEEHYKKAETFYNRVLTKPQKPESSRTPDVDADNEREEAASQIEKALNMYKNSLETGDIEGLKTLLLLTKDQEKAWSGFFKIAKNINVELQKENEQINHSNAKIDLLVNMSYHNTTTNSDAKRDFQTSLVFKVINGAWQVASRK